ncbi:hypothetical protein LMJF_34_4200 [Leishmania major strain Friedlin]|uniref:Uncharacterized protein n=1 Tax=Leishmania major TaxID=5664 RepID=Q4Q2C1_LEIMA|nr:hypothetical protein LMJF_34_4200 [Leishmania major strain Friedlin]CAG9582302.1 hypothetical_protein_-_conserved [Leishmania major strain Friedlin]CAJ08150.1 hypothetical protein LMJF_34_4200 [Leishmania major strain Friedlin]|eukprot:XP_001686527.1 hypothetical protein LMJF_34_4200 [Leishmania major strain Friedlin]
MPFSLGELQNVFLDALTGCPPDAPQQTRDTAVTVAGASIFAGSWQPLESTRVPVRAYLRGTGEFDTEDSCRRAVMRVVDATLNDVLNDDAVNAFIGAKACESADIVGACEHILRKYLLWMLDGYLHYDGTPQCPFYDALKSTVCAFSVEWGQTFGPMFAEAQSPDEFFSLLVTRGAQHHATAVATNPDDAKVRMATAMSIQVFLMAKTYSPSTPFPSRVAL